MSYDAWKTTPPREEWIPGPNDCECGRELELVPEGEDFCPECQPKTFLKSIERKCGCRELHELDTTSGSYRKANWLRVTRCAAHEVLEPSWCDEDPVPATPTAA